MKTKKELCLVAGHSAFQLYYPSPVWQPADILVHWDTKDPQPWAGRLTN